MKIGVQTILMIIFGILVAFAVAVFSGFISIGPNSGSSSLSGNVTIWGTYSSKLMNSYLKAWRQEYDNLQLEYVQKSEENFDEHLTEEMAEGKGPDLFFISTDQLLQHKGKITHIPYESFSKEQFVKTYAQASRQFLTPQGVAAVPILIDPFVLYYNKDLLRSNYKLKPPKDWNKFMEYGANITQQKDTGAIKQSAVAFGTATNIKNAKDIIALLSLQNSIPLVGMRRDKLSPVLSGKDTGLPSILNYYTSFANPSQDHYSWNASLPNSQKAFIGEQTAMYFGYASEIQQLRNRNPNLNFGVAVVPQLQNTSKKKGLAKVTGIAISKQSDNSSAAYEIAQKLSSQNVANTISKQFNLPPVFTSQLQNIPNEEVQATLHRSAIIADAWLDPNPSRTSEIFARMISQTLSGTMNPGNAVKKAEKELKTILDRIDISKNGSSE